MSELRPSSQERDRYLDLLSTAYADGRLDEAEFETRTNAVLAAVTHREAMAQFQGLPQPNIVPVQPPSPRPQPGPPQAFQPLPGPPQAFQPLPERLGGFGSRDVGRRGLMGGTVAVAAVLLLGVGGMVSMRSVPDEVMWGGADPALEWDPAPMHQQFADAGAALRDQGFDTVSEFTITGDQIGGVAGSSRNPGQGSSFTWFADGTFEASTGGDALGSSTIDLGEAEQLVLAAEEAGLSNLSGMVAQIELVWQGGAPTAKATAFNPDGWVQVDAAGGIIAMEGE